MQLEEKLDEIFSIYTRLRFADYRGDVHCYTCPALMPWKQMDCGHWKRRGYEATRWDKDNARPQCPICNRDANGKPDVFELELRQEIGDAAVEAVIERSRGLKTLDDEKKRRLLIHYVFEVKKLGSGL